MEQNCLVTIMLLCDQSYVYNHFTSIIMCLTLLVLVRIYTGPTAPRVCNIYSPNVTTNGALMDIPSGTQNVILYCICRRTNVAVGPTTWYINGVQVTRTQASGDNPYYRNNVPSPLIIPTFTATHAGTYGCGGLIVRDGVATVPTIPNVIIHLDISGIAIIIVCYT